ncbi:MAG: hypothetical protein MAG551_00432 [Candidatus Scalindua arabica]|uniref:Uncharacterized protein n=1 Tax=Candidatus Scalindua arabica TaxID=1127984 RepID=A0A941VZV7_9BACT|nr:hypothetical protein [Candidatus Scalindua arabica]
MGDNKNITNDQGSVNSLGALMDAVQITASSSRNIKNAADTIEKSCSTQGTRGEAHKSLLLDKADDMRSLAELYGSASRRFESAAKKLQNGIPEDKVWADVLAYDSFFSDQLKSEKCDYESVLNILHENTT